MKATVSKKTEAIFGNGFKTIIDGKQVEVTLSSFLANPKKYLKTGIAHMYENHEKLVEYYAKHSSENKAEVLDMEQAKRGKLFDKNAKNKVSSELAEMVKEQIARRKRIAERFERNKVAATETAVEKVVETVVEKTAETAKSDAEAKAAAAAKAKK